MRVEEQNDRQARGHRRMALSAAFVASALIASAAYGQEASPGPTVSWQTDQVSLTADAFRVEANDRVFTTEGAPLGYGSDPGGPDYWTLEVTWLEQDREQRLNMYFASDGADWWVDEIRTYDGYKQGEWIYYAGPLFRTPLGEAYEGDVRLEGSGTGRPRNTKNRVPGVLTIEAMRLGVSPQSLEDIAALPPDGGIATDRDPFARGGPLRCSDILMLEPAAAHERILDAGYRVAYRLNPYLGEDFDPTVPPEGVIEDTALDSYGNVIVFVIGPSLQPPDLSLPPDCYEASPGT